MFLSEIVLAAYSYDNCIQNPLCFINRVPGYCRCRIAVRLASPKTVLHSRPQIKGRAAELSSLHPVSLHGTPMRGRACLNPYTFCESLQDIVCVHQNH